MFEKNIKNQILELISVFEDVYLLERYEGVSIRDLEDTMNKIKLIDGALSEDSLKEFMEVYLPGLSSPFGKELSLNKCKMVLRNANIGILSNIKKSIESMVAHSKEIKNKNLILDDMYNLMGKYRDEVRNIKGEITGFEGKSEFLQACQSACTNNYRGLLYFGHSSISLAKVLDKVIGSAFDKEGPTHGKKYLEQSNIKERLGMVDYYLDREVIEKTSVERLQELFTDELDKTKESFNVLGTFPHLPGYKLDDMVEFMMKAYDSKKEDYQGATDDAQGNAIIWSELANTMDLALDVGIKFFNDVKPRLGLIGSNNFSSLLNLLEKLEESYKVHDEDAVKKYVELLKFGIVAESIVFHMELYDILSFVTSTEYMCFAFTLIYIMFATYKKDFQGKGKTVEKPTPENHLNEGTQEQNNEDGSNVVQDLEVEDQTQKEPKEQNNVDMDNNSNQPTQEMDQDL